MPPKAAATRSWTIMVYLAGDNNLDSAGVVDLKEMKSVGTSDKIAVLAQFDRSGNKGATTRYCLKKGTTIAKDAVQTLGETNMGDPKVLEDFVTWGVTNYPADHYLLVLWNHGAGWDDANLYQGDVFSGTTPPVSRKSQPVATRGVAAGIKPIAFAQARAGISRTKRALFSTTVASAVKQRGIAFDDQAQDFLDNVELKKVMTSIKKKLKRKIDILGMDACLMSMMEVYYQMRDVAEFSVGSEESEPGEGWPYDRILKALAAKPAMTPEELSKTIVSQYLASYKASDVVTQSAVNLSVLKPLATAVSSLATALTGVLSDTASRTALVNARAQVQEYSRPYDDYCDLLDLCDLLDKGITKPAVKTACAAVRQAASSAIVANGYKGLAVNNSRGISIYFPKRSLSPLYSTLDFTRQSRWDEFLVAYLAGLGR
ncbi:MAG: clostripain-related cysteine peptidase [Desulfuromonadaceae bacterium]|nr:clostripain-related cysteine peptidase [Desulfuromonadaceae bacterium]